MRRCASFSRRRRAQDVSALQLQTWLVHQAFRRCCEPCRPLPHLFRPAHHAAHVMMTLSRGFCIKMSYVGRPVQSLSISRRKSFRHSPAGECRSDGPTLPVSHAGIGVALMPALQKAPAWSTFIFQISTRVFKNEVSSANRLKLAGRPPLLPLRSPCNLKREFA